MNENCIFFLKRKEYMIKVVYLKTKEYEMSSPTISGEYEGSTNFFYLPKSHTLIVTVLVIIYTKKVINKLQQHRQRSTKPKRLLGQNYKARHTYPLSSKLRASRCH